MAVYPLTKYLTSCERETVILTENDRNPAKNTTRTNSSAARYMYSESITNKLTILRSTQQQSLWSRISADRLLLKYSSISKTGLMLDLVEHTEITSWHRRHSIERWREAIAPTARNMWGQRPHMRLILAIFCNSTTINKPSFVQP